MGELEDIYIEFKDSVVKNPDPTTKSSIAEI